MPNIPYYNCNQASLAAISVSVCMSDWICNWKKYSIFPVGIFCFSSRMIWFWIQHFSKRILHLWEIGHLLVFWLMFHLNLEILKAQRNRNKLKQTKTIPIKHCSMIRIPGFYWIRQTNISTFDLDCYCDIITILILLQRGMETSNC